MLVAWLCTYLQANMLRQTFLFKMLQARATHLMRPNVSIARATRRQHESVTRGCRCAHPHLFLTRQVRGFLASLEAEALATWRVLELPLPKIEDLPHMDEPFLIWQARARRRRDGARARRARAVRDGLLSYPVAFSSRLLLTPFLYAGT